VKKKGWAEATEQPTEGAKMQQKASLLLFTITYYCQRVGCNIGKGRIEARSVMQHVMMALW
jgi:hypothetical protein